MNHEQTIRRTEQCYIERHWNKEYECWIDRRVDLEKFAELIVKECVDVTIGLHDVAIDNKWENEKDEPINSSN